ncbi:hypothetical protein [Bacillus sp. B-jedd]|uniref:hypothetical protein n=1 Tax=Bacillus sp. B-jedd TaxID=1476857 RepID=UPI0005155AC7|nr:hypothetical protein [Bacillus sp. B-jedd]CEG28066.1 IncA protein [Bacillus sp. B-jedd]
MKNIFLLILILLLASCSTYDESYYESEYRLDDIESIIVELESRITDLENDLSAMEEENEELASELEEVSGTLDELLDEKY